MLLLVVVVVVVAVVGVGSGSGSGSYGGGDECGGIVVVLSSDPMFIGLPFTFQNEAG